MLLFVFFEQGRAGADGGRGEIGEVGAKVGQKKSVEIITSLFTQQLFSLFSSHASSFARVSF